MYGTPELSYVDEFYCNDTSTCYTYTLTVHADTSTLHAYIHILTVHADTSSQYAETLNADALSLYDDTFSLHTSS